MNPEPPRASDYVAHWVASRREQIGGTQLRFFQQEKHGRTFSAQFETPRYFLEFLAWDQGHSVDLFALSKDTGGQDYAVSGGCEGIAGVSERLEAFLEWLNANEPNRAA